MKSRGTITEQLHSLLHSGEPLPTEVLRCAELLAMLGIWHCFSRNAPATGCQEAARRRNRLGHEGIPLWDELKSFLGEYNDMKEDVHKIFLAHCRGDRELDFGKLKNALPLAGEIRRATL